MDCLRNLLLNFGLFFAIATSCYGQMSPPEPMAQDASNPRPCSEVTDNGGNPAPVPPGLCLPIDDYVYILMGAGLVVGCYQFRKFDLA